MISISKIEEILKTQNYIASPDVIIAIYLSLEMKKPLLIEGGPGCGKTELAKVMANGFQTELIRLQCYEGLELNQALYEWDYLRQLVKIRISEETKDGRDIESALYDEKYLLKRPLLSALLYEGANPPVLLIDEIDRADEEFEAFILEFLAEYQVTIPELGTVKARQIPITILTSNRTRALGDGIRRRCLYLYVDYPSPEKELEVLTLKVPSIKHKLALEIVNFMQELRRTDGITKRPGIAETIDWAASLVLLNKDELDLAVIESTLSSILKTGDDILAMRNGGIQTILAKNKKSQ